jgi:hypothetical protein
LHGRWGRWSYTARFNICRHRTKKRRCFCMYALALSVEQLIYISSPLSCKLQPQGAKRGSERSDASETWPHWKQVTILEPPQCCLFSSIHQ